MAKEFEWTDELVTEFQYFKQLSFPTLTLQQRIDEFKKSKNPKPLFTTEDGINIYEGQPCYSVSKISIQIGYVCNSNVVNAGHHESYLYFSTEKAAENYIKCHKPVLSLKDVLGCLTSSGYVDNYYEIKQNLTNIVKSKIK